jgi:hypothetical protein
MSAIALHATLEKGPLCDEALFAADDLVSRVSGVPENPGQFKVKRAAD